MAVPKDEAIIEINEMLKSKNHSFIFIYVENETGMSNMISNIPMDIAIGVLREYMDDLIERN